MKYIKKSLSQRFFDRIKYMRVIITRHGETEENKVGILQGYLPGKLSAQGIVQAKKLALRLKDEKIDYIFSSDLARAADTAKEIAKYHSEIPIKFVKGLRERDIGELQGKRKDEIDWETNKRSIVFITSNKGETLEDLYNRAEKFLHDTLHEHREDNVLFVCHGGVGKALIAVITGKTPLDIRAMDSLDNTSVSIFDIDEDKNHKIICLNCTNHLT